ncbi:45736_t:CDS:2, partial [Gigaspora margarita]
IFVILNNESKTQLENPWVILADKALKGAFNDMLVFTGLCEVMVIFGGISSRALDLFCKNLEVIALIPNNGTDTAYSILQLYKQLIIGIVLQLGLHILFLGSDSTIIEFQAQQSISKTQTNEKLIVKNLI